VALWKLTVREISLNSSLYLCSSLVTNPPTPFETHHLFIPVSTLHHIKQGVMFTDEYAIAWKILWNFSLLTSCSLCLFWFFDYGFVFICIYIYTHSHTHTHTHKKHAHTNTHTHAFVVKMKRYERRKGRNLR